MRSSHTFTTIVLLLCTLQLHSQETRFFMPREITEAYKNGTRSYDGKPGPNYWQNTVDYAIEVKVIPSEKKLEGSESVVYHNNSPDNLNSIVIRLYHDVFRKANPRAYRVRPDDITEGVELSRLVVNGESYDPGDSRRLGRNGTNMSIPLSKPLKSGESLTLEIDWAQQIPETTVRTGAYDSTSFFLAYWYPQVAVYDDVFGWDDLSYDFSTEFYNNLGNFDVKITAPENFTVLSTGVLQNAAEVLVPEKLEQYQKAKTSSETIAIVSPEDLEGDFRHRSGTWHYTASEVSDFSFCLSDHFCWDAANQEVDGRNVLINTFYPAADAADCGEVTAMQQKIMKHFSEDVPGIPYPYPEFTTFISSVGGGGMETPMMANNGNPGLGVTVHEMFHTYFPMYVRVNEKRFAWMDEGWADFNTALVSMRYFQDDDGLIFGNVSGGISGTMGTISDLPLITSTQFMDFTNYGYASYPLPAFMYATLHHHLGEEIFLQCYREYIRRWALKSPTPYDFFYTFEEVSGQDLSWFWIPWFFNYGYADVAISSFDAGKLTVENRGTRPVPVTVKVEYQDSTTALMSAGAGVWTSGNTHSFSIDRPDEVASIEINSDIPDTEGLNNLYPPLKDRYKGFKVSDAIFGDYVIAQYGVTISVSKREEGVFMEASGANFQSYLIPKSEVEYVSLEGGATMIFALENDQCSEALLKVSGLELKAVKQ